MKRDELNDLSAFVVVADEMSFTRAAARLGMSPSALSHAMKALEARLGLRLLARTTRSVRATEAGEQLLRTLRPAFEDIGAELMALSSLRDKPAGTLRITTFQYAATSVVWPVLPAFLDANPDVRVELTIDDGLTDIVASRYDAGIRFGEKVGKDMIAVRVGPDLRFAVVDVKVNDVKTVQGWAVGYHYALSKRTTVYADLASNSKAATEKQGYDFGVKHAF